MHSLLKASGRHALAPNTPEELEYIMSACELCLTIRTAPRRYRVTMGAEIPHFNAEVYFDLMYIERDQVQQMVDDATYLSEARLLDTLIAEWAWETIHMLWVTVLYWVSKRVIFR